MLDKLRDAGSSVLFIDIVYVSKKKKKKKPNSQEYQIDKIDYSAL